MKEKLKIIQLIQRPQLRGAEIFACQLSNHLIAKGHSVWIVCLFPGESILPFAGKIIYLDRKIRNRFWDIEGWKRFMKIIRQINPDIIQANAADTLKFSVCSKIFFKFKTPIIFRNANKISDFIDNPLKLLINKIYLSKVSMVISVSKICRNDFISTFNFPKVKVRTVPVGIENIVVDEGPRDIEGIIKNNKVIVHIGSFVPEKNHLGLLRIFSKVLEYHPSTVLLLLGKGKLEPLIKKAVLNLNLQNQVFFLHYRSDALSIIKISNLLVLPSIIEGLPAVLLESMSCKTPVIAYEVGGVSEIISSDTGILIKKDDEEGFVGAIVDSLSFSNKQRVDRAYEMVQQQYRNKKLAKKFLKKYKIVKGLFNPASN